MRVTFLFCAVLCACFCAQASAWQRGLFERIILTPADAIKHYEGKWKGSQNIFLPDGRMIMKFIVEQNYYWTVVDNERVLVCSGSMTSAGDRIDVFSEMRDKFTHLELKVKDAKNVEYVYCGYVVKKAIVWVPRARCLRLDVQNDMFNFGSEQTDLFSEGVKDVYESGYKGGLIVKAHLEKKLEKKFEQKKSSGGFRLKKGKGTLFE